MTGDPGSLTPMPTVLPVTDRSRFTLGWGRCMRARFLNYHFGPTSYGIRPKRHAIPLVVGITVHAVLAEILGVARAGGHLLPDRAAMRSIVKLHVEHYKVGARAGFQQVADDAPEVQYIVEEQAALLAGLCWAFYRVVLPMLLETYEILEIEREEGYVAGCDCGLGDGVGERGDHEGRGCGGVYVMLRPDLILKERANGVIYNLDFKTGGNVLDRDWREQFEDNTQLALGSAGTERRLGEAIDFAMILGLNKGWRKRTKNPEDFGRMYTGPKRQDSIFCYAWKREGNEPSWQEDWKWSFEYEEWDEKKRGGAGMVRRTLKGKGYDKSPVWLASFAGRLAEQDPIEYWVDSLPEEVLKAEFNLVGPIPVSRWLVPATFRSIAAEEKRWVERLWKVYEATEAAGGDWTQEEPQKVLDEEIPRSWECHRFKSKCEFLRVCKQDVGWEDPLGSGNFVLRRPHHEPELQQMVDRGITPPAEYEGQEEAEVE